MPGQREQQHSSEQTEKQRKKTPSETGTFRTVRLDTERRNATQLVENEHEEDAPIPTLHRSTSTDTKVLIGVILVALFLCLLGLAISLTSTPPRPTLPLNPRPVAPGSGQRQPS